MKNIKNFLFIFIFSILFFLEKIKTKAQVENCTSCSCSIDEYRKQIKELENLLTIYRKENVALMEKIASIIEHSSREAALAHEKYYTHLVKCTGRK